MSLPTSTKSLERLVHVLDFDLGEVDELPTGDSASILRVLTNGEIAVKSLDGEHPFDALLGFVAPDDWEIFGVIAPGWGTHYAGPKRGERRRMRAIHVVSRAGEEASLLHFAGEEPELAPDGHVPGRVADCIRRAMNVPTDPEPDESLLSLWWDRVLQRLVAHNHPSLSASPVGRADIDELIGERPVSWGDERWKAVAEGGNLRMDDALAAWMDDGMFARFMLAGVADADVALPAAKRACTPEAWTYLLACFAFVAMTELDEEF
jgi:hypothetical protein